MTISPMPSNAAVVSLTLDDRHPDESRPAGRDIPDLELVIPAINEERRIGPTVEALTAHLGIRPWSSGLVVVDNGSTDTTTEVVDRAHGGGVAIEVIGCRQRGKGAAVRAGVLHSQARWVGYCDADLATPPSAIDAAVELLLQGVDVVVGSRRCLGAEYVVPQPLLRRMGGNVFHAAAGTLVKGVTDTQCGFKMFAGHVARTLFAPARVQGFAFDIEVLARAVRAGMKVVELPVQWSDRDGSTFKPLSDGTRALRDLLAVRRSLLVGAESTGAGR